MTNTQTAVEERHVFLETTPTGLAFIEFDAPGRSNSLSSHVIEEFEECLQKLEKDDSVRAVCLYSRKPDHFLMGADLREIATLETKEAALALTQRGHGIFDKLADLNKLTVAGINGACLGGGLEMALCCDKRIATDSPQTMLGLPEVNLGFVPGLGGTQRLPRLIGLKPALEMILSADPIGVRQAKECGLVSDIVPVENFKATIERLVSGYLFQGLPEKQNKAPVALEKKDASLLAATRRAVRIKTRGFYPAQTRVLDVIESGLLNGMKKGIEDEAETFAELAVSEISRNLVLLFFASELAKHTAASAAAKEPDSQAKTIAVIGGGTMGTGMAALLAAKGYQVLFRPQRLKLQGRDQMVMIDAINRNAARGVVPSEDFSPVEFLEDDRQFAQADIIFEAVEENAATKLSAFERALPYAKKDCIFATITSSLSVADLRSKLPAERQLMALHFFNPVDKMPLVEIASHPSISRSSSARVSGVVSKLDKIPVAVKDTPCFLVNRLLCCYLMETARLAEAKVPLPWIDAAAYAFGMPMGPLVLLDEIGLDLAVIVANSLNAIHGERVSVPPSLIAAQKLGLNSKKTNNGIIIWDESGKKSGFNPLLGSELHITIDEQPATPEELANVARRLFLPVIDEAARCLEEKVVRRAREVDVSTVFGIGFPAFRGGLLRYADSLGLANVAKELTAIYAQTMPARTVSDTIKKHAAAGTRFYPQSAPAD